MTTFIKTIARENKRLLSHKGTKELMVVPSFRHEDETVPLLLNCPQKIKDKVYFLNKICNSSLHCFCSHIIFNSHVLIYIHNTCTFLLSLSLQYFLKLNKSRHELTIFFECNLICIS